MRFIKEALLNPQSVGTLFPSSQRLAHLITDSAVLAEKSCIVELGPGSGVFTKHILEKKRKDSVFFGMEINEEMLNITQRRCPEAILYQAPAQELRSYLPKHGMTSCDCIISSIPWANLGEKTQREAMSAISEALEEDGLFLTYAYIHGLALPTGKRFRKMLDATFSSVEKTPIVWGNIPPAFVYLCRK